MIEAVKTYQSLLWHIRLPLNYFSLALSITINLGCRCVEYLKRNRFTEWISEVSE